MQRNSVKVGQSTNKHLQTKYIYLLLDLVFDLEFLNSTSLKIRVCYLRQRRILCAGIGLCVSRHVSMISDGQISIKFSDRVDNFIYSVRAGLSS